jgi:tetratricopeptide (TPR) repeat protein
MADLFQLQDDLERQVAAALRVPLAHGESGGAEPPRPEAYEAYLRGAGVVINTASTTSLRSARDHFRRAVELDPRLAPAWARLGRVHRILAKYGHGAYDENRRLARQAFDTALALDPDSPLAHNLYTHFEIEDLASPVQALLRLLGRVERAPADAELFAGLVVACRFTGLLEASLAAHRQAVRLDPEVRTSVHYTYWMMGEYEKAARYDRDPTRLVAFCALPMLGRRDEALATFASWRAGIEAGLELDLGDAVHAALRRDAAACRAAAARLLGFLDSRFRDGEGFYFLARSLAEAGAVDEAIAALGRVVEAGFTCPSTMAGDPWLDALRSDPRFLAVAKLAADGHRHAREVFERAEGPRLLSLDDDPTVTLPGLSRAR